MTVSLLLDPALVEEPESQVVVAGTSTSLKCAAVSNSNLTIVWTKDDQEISLPALIENGVGVLRHDILFPNVAASDIGSYVCTAKSTFLMRDVSSNPALLDVFSESYINSS